MIIFYMLYYLFILFDWLYFNWVNSIYLLAGFIWILIGSIHAGPTLYLWAITSCMICQVGPQVPLQATGPW